MKGYDFPKREGNNMKKIVCLLLIALVGNMFISPIHADNEEVSEATTPETFAQMGTLRFEKYPSNRSTVAMPKQPVVEGVYKDEVFSYNVSMTYTGTQSPAFVLSMQPGLRYEGYTILTFKNTHGVEKSTDVIKAHHSGNNIVFLFTEIEQYDIIQFDVHFTAIGEVGSTIDGRFGCWQGGHPNINWKDVLIDGMGIDSTDSIEVTGEYSGTLPTDHQIFNETSDISNFWFGDNHPITPVKIIEKDTTVTPPEKPLIPLVPPVKPVVPIVPVVPVQPEVNPSVKPNEKNDAKKPVSVSTSDTNAISDLVYLIVLSGGIMLLIKKLKLKN